MDGLNLKLYRGSRLIAVLLITLWYILFNIFLKVGGEHNILTTNELERL